MKKIILYVGNFEFPVGNAAGKRVYANGKIFSDLGYRVIYIGVSKESGNQKLSDSKASYHDSFEYYTLPYPKKMSDWLNYKSVYSEIVQFIEKNKFLPVISALIYYGSPALSLFNKHIIKYCRRNNIKVLSDCVDWLTVKTGNIVFDLVKLFDTTYQKAYMNKRVDGVIAISSYLAEYYNTANVKTVIIPPLTPKSYDTAHESDNYKIIITYAGLPFRKNKKIPDCGVLKDRIDKTISMLDYAKSKKCSFVFNIYGFTAEEYVSVLPEQKEAIERLGDSIQFHSFMKNDEIVKKVTESDFTILIRDNIRDTQAGFPTKVSESISCGTPVITTPTSDLRDYLKDGENCYFLDFDYENAADRLVEILLTKKETITEMKNRCAVCNPFDYRLFTKKMEEFLYSL